MKINKERIRENSVKCKNTMQITLDDDFNVPDSKADIDSIIRESAFKRCRIQRPRTSHNRRGAAFWCGTQGKNQETEK